MMATIWRLTAILALCNMWSVMHASKCNVLHHGLFIDCSYRDLDRIPDDLSTTATTIDLSHNIITAIPNNTFQHFHSLVHLNFSHNRIQGFQDHSFAGLRSLLSLNIESNVYEYSYESFPLDTFTPLTSLHTLILSKSNTDATTCYPDQSFAKLSNLDTLYIGMTTCPFGDGFRNLTQLQTLSSTQVGCSLISVSLETFSVFRHSNLKNLALENCGIQNLSREAFSGLNLKNLSVVGASLGLPQALYSLEGLENSTMDVIRFSQINEHVHFVDNFAIELNATKSLRSICMKEIDLSHNEIVSIDIHVMFHLKEFKCVESFSVRGHQIKDPWLNSWMALYLGIYPIVQNLTYYDISGMSHPMEKRNPDERIIRDAKKEDNHSAKNVSLYQFPIPPLLDTINMSYIILEEFFLNATYLTINDNNSLRVFDISYNGAAACLIQIRGITKLKDLRTAGSNCSKLDPHFLDAYPQLETLDISKSNLNQGLLHDPNGLVFKSVPHLIELDLSDNGLAEIHKSIFLSNQHITELNLGNNKFATIPDAVFTITSLTLDLSYNGIFYLDQQTSEKLDEFASKTIFTLHLKSNPLSCGCNAIDFLQWMAESKILFPDLDSQTCLLQNGTRRSIRMSNEELDDLKLACQSQIWLVLSICLVVAAIISISIGAVLYKYRWNIRCWLYTKFKYDYEQMEQEKEYEYDAFVAYNEDDLPFVCNLVEYLENRDNYHICIHSRDFRAGMSIQQNIMDAITNSRKIILVISERFVSCDWGEWEIQMAGMKMVERGRDSLIIAIMLDELPMKKMPQALVNLWKNITFLLWSEDNQEQQELFWGRLDDAMKR